MKEEANDVTVQIKYKDIQENISGNPEEVWLSINKLLSELIPTFETANKLMLRVDLHRLMKDCEGIIAFSKDGASLLVPRAKLTDNETLSLWLVANYVGCQLGILKDDTVSKDELQTKLGKNAKIAGTRLGELVKNGTAARTPNEEYRITTFGITQIQKDTLPRIKARIEA